MGEQKKRVITALAVTTMASTGLASCGGGGGSSSPPPPPADTQNPAVSFSQTTLTVNSGATANVTLTATDNVGIVTGPVVSCTNAGSFSNNVFTAPAVATQTTVVCTATATDAAGNQGTATLTVTVEPPADTENPMVSFAPTTLSVSSGGTGTSTLTATDNVGITTGPDVNCTNGGSFTGSTFTAPTVNNTTTVVCTATASDAAGNQGTGTLTVTVEPIADTQNPVVTFTPAALTVASSGTGASTLTATDNVGVTTGPDVNCTNGGAFANNTFTAPAVAVQTSSVCTATASDAAGNQGTGTLTVTIDPPVPGTVQISGKVTYDLVPLNTVTNGLNYNAITQAPAKGIIVEAIDGSGAVLATSNTDASGDYTLTVNSQTDMRIRAKAQMLQTSGATWDVKVTDNTSGDALYAIVGANLNSGVANSTRNLNAASGWGGSSYTATRAAAPFAILAPIYDGLQKVAAVDADVVFAPMEFRWSFKNRAVNGDRTIGDIGTSFYTRTNGVSTVYLLGDDGSDTDEYDDHVVVHEWGHYFEDRLSRSDSIGGSHSTSDRLDLRVAFGEGFGNAWSAIVTDDPVYRDSFGNQNASGFEINVENNNQTNTGWFNSGSVQSIIYDLYDSTADGADNIALGLGPIYETLVSPNYTGNSLVTSIFTFIDELKTQSPANTAAITAIVAAQTISGTGPDGAGETNSGSIAETLPVFKTATVNGGAITVCSANDAGSYNKLGNRGFVRFTVGSAGNHTITVTRTSGAASTDPDIELYKNGLNAGSARSGVVNSETLTRNLAAGEYVIDVTDFNNTGGGAGLDACFSLTVTG